MRDKLIENALYEMALSAGDGSELSYLDSHVYRQKMYQEHKSDEHVSHNIYRKPNDDHTEYTTLDHSTEEATHHSYIKHRKSGYRNIPFDHDEQLSVNSHKGSHLNQSTKVMLFHIEHSNKPLVSFEIQSDQGHKLWKTFAKSALDKGHNVYYHDHNGLVKLDHKNLDHYHKKYFGDSIRNENTNMLVSKEELK
jgi:hypothetical protein